MNYDVKELSSEELIFIEAGNPVVKKAVEWVFYNYAWETLSNAVDDFAEGWNSVEDHEC